MNKTGNEKKNTEGSFAEIRDPLQLWKTSRSIKNYLTSFLKWAGIAIVIGVVSGMVGALFQLSISFAAGLFSAYQWLIFLLPAAGPVIAGCYHLFRIDEETGTNLILNAIRGTEKVPFALAPCIFIGTVLTHLCGGSAGREGAALQLGGAIGTRIGKFFHLSRKEFSPAIMCGMSGVFAALFGTPLTASFFAMEVISVGIYYHAGFIPCLTSALIAYRISVFFGLTPVAFSLPTVPALSLTSVLQVAALSALCAALSILFCFSMHKSAHFLKKIISNEYLRAFIGGLAVVLLTLLVGNRDYNSTGMSVIIRAMNGEAFPAAFLIKILFTALTLGSGFKGGEIVPSFFVGATFGCVMGPLFGMDPGFAAAIGLISVFCGSVNCPIASIFMSYEMFGGEGLILFAGACGISYILSGYYGLYSSQKIVYSKLQAEYINVQVK